MEKETSKELQAINDALVNYYRVHGGNVSIICEVVAFDDSEEVESNVVDDMFWIVGNKGSLEVMSEYIAKSVDHEHHDEYWEC